MGVNVPDARCRACRQAPETLMHLLSACRTYAGTAYVHRHNAALRVLYYHLRHSYGIDENLARVDSSSPLCWSQAQEKREGWKPHFCKTTHTQNPQRNTTHRHQPRNSDLFKFFRGRTPGLIAWAVAMNKPG
nr:unnamed protein product [Callosobruchus chinensis]